MNKNNELKSVKNCRQSRVILKSLIGQSRDDEIFTRLLNRLESFLPNVINDSIDVFYEIYVCSNYFIKNNSVSENNEALKMCL